MTIVNNAIGPLSGLLDTFITDPKARDAAKLELLRLAADAPPDPPSTASSPAIAAEAAAPDRWTSRARPSFLYVMYALLLWSIPLGLIAAIRPALARDIAGGMTAYLAGIPEPLYALFGTGYLGYTVARTWGKVEAWSADRPRHPGFELGSSVGQMTTPAGRATLDAGSSPA